MKHVYLFSGLGADKRVFQYLDLSGYNITYIEWIKHHEHDTIEQYAKRLTDQITSEKPILIGVSFGGMMALEVAKFMGTEKIILISSAKNRNEIPSYFHSSGKTTLLEIIPNRFMVQPTLIHYWLFGAISRHDKKLLDAIIRDTDPRFLKWALKKIATWHNRTIHANLRHIHGSTDRILPHRFISCDATIEGGGHLMIVNRSEDVSRWVRAILES